ncbi:MAG: thioesterase [Clostridiales bacterium]|nr:thioesterase [Clostridiales bacterium]
MNRKKVFLLPYAGGSSIVYYKLTKLLSDDLEAVSVELAGRGMRINESLYHNIDEAAEDIAEFIGENIEDSQYGIFGHSMGALLAFEVYYKLKERKVPLPGHIFFSGRSAPHIKHRRIYVERYSDHLFLDLVSLYGGLPKEMYDDQIKEKFLPILRADFKMIDEYEYIDKMIKIHCDISVLYGEKDFSVDNKAVEEWDKHTNGKAHIYCFPGNHFYLNDEYDNIAKIIKDTII